MVEHEFYAQHLLCLGHGLAIYEPDPADEYDELRVGDVGHMKDGGFHRLFNVFRKEDDKVNELGVPEGFEPLPPKADNTYSRLPLPAGVMASSTIVQQGGGLGAGLAPGLPLQAGASIQLSCSNRLGAALITSHPSYRLDSSATLTLSKYMLKNYRSWVHFARDKLGRDITVKDIVLVTGRDLTKQWATATFIERHRDASINFQVGDGFGSIIGGAGLALWGSWSSNLLIPHRCGPQQVKPPDGDGASETAIAHVHGGLERSASPSSKYNQCVFIRGFRVRERAWSLLKTIKAAAEGADRDNVDDYDPNHLSPLLATKMDRSVNTSTDGEQIELIHGTPERDGQMGRIYDVFAEHLFEKTDADVALLHDNEICVPFQCELIETPEELRECLNNAVSDATFSVEDTNGVKVGRWIPPKLDITKIATAVAPVIEAEGDVFSWKIRIPSSGTVTVGGPTNPGSSATIISRDVAEVLLPKHDHVPTRPEDKGGNPSVSMDLWETISPPQDNIQVATSPPLNTLDPVDSSSVDKPPTETPETQRTPNKEPIPDGAPSSPSKEHPAGASASPIDGYPTKEVPPEPAQMSPAPKSPGPVPPVSVPPETVSPGPVSQGPASPTPEEPNPTAVVPGPKSPGLEPPTSPTSDPTPEPAPGLDPVPEQTGSSPVPPEAPFPPQPAPPEPEQEVPQPTPTTPAVTPPYGKSILPCSSIDIDANENIWLEAYIENRADDGTEKDLESDFMCRISQNEVLCLRMGPDNSDVDTFNEPGRVVEAITTSDGVTDVIVTVNHDGRTRPIRRWRIPKHKTVCVKVVANEKIVLPALASVKAIDGKSMGLDEHQVERDTITHECRFPDEDSPVGNGRAPGFGAGSSTCHGDV